MGRPRDGLDNPQINGLVDSLEMSVDDATRAPLQRQIMQIVLQQLPILPLYWNVENMTIRKGMTGPDERTGRNVSYPLATWNVAQWDVNFS